MQLFELNLLKASQYFGRVLFNQIDADIGIQQVTDHSNTLQSRSCVCSGCSRPFAMKSSENCSSDAIHCPHESSIGSKMILFPCLEIITSLPGNLNSLGNRTACERPFWKSFAVAMMLRSWKNIYKKYIQKVYIMCGFWSNEKEGMELQISFCQTY